MLRLDDRWVWDFWIADTGTDYHLFFLQAPRSLGDQVLRHLNATVGHAVSEDLRALDHRWETPWRPAPRAPGRTWRRGPGRCWNTTGPGTSSIPAPPARRWGPPAHRSGDLDRSLDLDEAPGQPAHRGGPTLVRAGRVRRLARIPGSFRDPAGEGFHALITARATHGPADARGVIGHAWSPDLVRWEVRPPLSEPGEFHHLEVPQVEVVEGTPVLLFSATSMRIGAQRRARLPGEPTGSFLATGESLLGPWDIGHARPIPVPDLYSARIIRDRAGEWQVLGFYDASERGAFVGETVRPVPLKDLGLP